MTPQTALLALKERANPERAAQMSQYHKVSRDYLGIGNPEIDRLVREWRPLPLEARLAIAAHLWRSNIHEARIAAAKSLTQARIRPDAEIWAEISKWVTDFDAWAIADHACSAGARRLVADPARLDEVERWTESPNLWVRRAALVMTLPWSKQNHPTDAEFAARERILGWATGYVADREWFIQKSIAWWLRSLSKHDPTRVRKFLEHHGEDLKAFARKEAGKYLA